MNKYQNYEAPDLIEILLFKLEEVWRKLKWWQRLLLGGVYQEIKDILEALSKKGKGTN